MQVGSEVRRVVVVEPGPAGERERRHGRPVVGLRRRDDPPAVGLAALDVVAPGQADGRLVRLGAAGDEVGPREAFRRERESSRASSSCGVARELLVVEERDAARLRPGRLDELGDAVTDQVTIAPPPTASR